MGLVLIKFKELILVDYFSWIVVLDVIGNRVSMVSVFDIEIFCLV